MIDAELLNNLDKVFTKKTLELGILPLVKKFFHLPGNHEYCRSDIAEIMQKLVNNKTITKNEALHFCLSVFENEIIYKGFKESLPEPIQILIETLLWRDSISNKEAEKLLKQPLTYTNNLKRSYMVEEELIGGYYFFSVNQEMNYGQKPSFTLSINTFLKRVLVEFYPKPKNYHFLPLKNIPPTDFIFTAENKIELELQMMLPYYHQNGIKYSSKGRPLEGSLNKLQRAVNITEFFPEEIGFSAKTRTMLMAGLFYDINPSYINIDSISLLKTLINHNYAKHNTVDFILLHLKGWGYLTDFEHHINVESQFLEIVRQFPADGKWISMENLSGFIESRFIDLKPVENYALGYRIYFETLADSKYYKEKTNIYRDWYHLVNDPFIKGSIFLFAAMGLMEIAYDDVDTEEFSITFSSEYDNLRYMRLTPLGAYILGLSDHYTPTHEHTKNKMTLQEDSLMIHTEGDMAVHELMLAKFAEKAGGNRFKVTASLFLKDCLNYKYIENKITLFKQIVREKLPPFWERQFQTWLSNAGKLQEDITTKLFKIPANDKNLQRTIVTDDVLKKIILKAEQFYILVPTSKVSIFKSRMKELGYVID